MPNKKRLQFKSQGFSHLRNQKETKRPRAVCAPIPGPEHERFIAVDHWFWMFSQISPWRPHHWIPLKFVDLISFSFHLWRKKKTSQESPDSSWLMCFETSPTPMGAVSITCRSFEKLLRASKVLKASASRVHRRLEHPIEMVGFPSLWLLQGEHYSKIFQVLGEKCSMSIFHELDFWSCTWGWEPTGERMSCFQRLAVWLKEVLSTITSRWYDQAPCLWHVQQRHMAK